MKELRIFDKAEGRDYLISIGELIKRIEQMCQNIFSGQWAVKKGAYGYGELICSIEDGLKNSEQYLIDGENIFPILKSNEEYFHHGCLKKINSDIEIGIFDSTFLFIRSSSDMLINEVGSFFKEIKILDCK